MSVSLVSSSGTSVYGVKEYVIDTEKELTNIPENCGPGSTAICAENGKSYIKNSLGEWVENKSTGSSGSGDGSADPADLQEIRAEIAELKANSGDYEKLINKPFGDDEARELVVEWDDEASFPIVLSKDALVNGEYYALTIDGSEYIYEAQIDTLSLSLENKQIMYQKLYSEISEAQQFVILLPDDAITKSLEELYSILPVIVSFGLEDNIWKLYIVSMENGEPSEKPIPAGKIEHITYKKIKPKYLPDGIRTRKILQNFYIDEGFSISSDKTSITKNFWVNMTDWDLPDFLPIFGIPGLEYKITINNQYSFIGTLSLETGALAVNILNDSNLNIFYGPDTTTEIPEDSTYRPCMLALMLNSSTITEETLPDFFKEPFILDIEELWPYNYLPNLVKINATDNGAFIPEPVSDINQTILELQGAIHDLIDYSISLTNQLKEANIEIDSFDTTKYKNLLSYFNYTNLADYKSKPVHQVLPNYSLWSDMPYKIIKELPYNSPTVVNPTWDTSRTDH